MMIRRLEIGLFRMRTAFNKKSATYYKCLIAGGSCGAAILMTTPVAHNAAGSALMGDGKGTSEVSSVSMRGGGGSGKGGPGDSSSGEDAVDAVIDQIMPYVQKLGFGGIMGVCTGVALKRLGNQAAGVIGLGFVCLQGLAYMGYIDIDYGKVKDDAKKLVDQDGDGKLTSKDVKMLWHKIRDMLTYHLPGMGGFSAGFLIGVRYGS